VSSVLLHTDIIIEVLRERDEAILTRWRRLAVSPEPVLYTAVTTAELWHGIRTSEESRAQQLLSALFCVPLTADIGRRAGGYLREFHASHGMGLGDALIAATAKVHGCALWTRNHKHYPMKGLRFY